MLAVATNHLIIIYKYVDRPTDCEMIGTLKMINHILDKPLPTWLTTLNAHQFRITMTSTKTGRMNDKTVVAFENAAEFILSEERKNIVIETCTKQRYDVLWWWPNQLQEIVRVLHCITYCTITNKVRD